MLQIFNESLNELCDNLLTIPVIDLLYDDMSRIMAIRDHGKAKGTITPTMTNLLDYYHKKYVDPNRKLPEMG